MKDETSIRVISNGKSNTQIVVIKKDAKGKRSSETRHLRVNSALNGLTDYNGNIYREVGGSLKIVGNVRNAA